MNIDKQQIIDFGLPSGTKWVVRISELLTLTNANDILAHTTSDIQLPTKKQIEELKNCVFYSDRWDPNHGHIKGPNGVDVAVCDDFHNKVCLWPSDGETDGFKADGYIWTTTQDNKCDLVPHKIYMGDRYQTLFVSSAQKMEVANTESPREVAKEVDDFTKRYLGSGLLWTKVKTQKEKISNITIGDIFSRLGDNYPKSEEELKRLLEIGELHIRDTYQGLTLGYKLSEEYQENILSNRSKIEVIVFRSIQEKRSNNVHRTDDGVVPEWVRGYNSIRVFVSENATMSNAEADLIRDFIRQNDVQIYEWDYAEPNGSSPWEHDYSLSKILSDKLGEKFYPSELGKHYIQERFVEREPEWLSYKETFVSGMTEIFIG